MSAREEKVEFTCVAVKCIDMEPPVAAALWLVTDEAQREANRMGYPGSHAVAGVLDPFGLVPPNLTH